MIYNWTGNNQQYYGANVIVWDSPYAIIGQLLSVLIVSYIDGYLSYDPILRQFGDVWSKDRPSIIDRNISPNIKDGMRPKIKK